MADYLEHLEKDIRTNQEIFTYLCNRSKIGPMSESVIAEAIRHYTKTVISSPRPLVEEPRALVSQQAWWDWCELINAEIVDLYKMNDDPLIRKAHDARVEREEDEEEGDDN